MKGVITLFLPLGFSQVLARKTRQLRQSRVDPIGVRRIKRTLRRARNTFPGVWGGLTKFDRGVDRTKNKI